MLEALDDGSHGGYLDDADSVRFDRVRDDGNAILGHVFGSKDTSRAARLEDSATCYAMFQAAAGAPAHDHHRRPTVAAAAARAVSWAVG